MKRWLISLVLAILAFLVAAPVPAQVTLTWQETLSETDTYGMALNPLDNRIVYTQKNGLFYVSRNGGITWQAKGPVPAGQVRNILVNPLDTGSVFVVANGIWKSRDGGATFDQVLGSVIIDGETLDFNGVNPDTMYFADFSGGHFFVSADTGNTWSYVTSLPTGFVCALASNPVHPNILIAGSGNSSISRSTDGGLSWSVVHPGTAYFSEVPKIMWDRFDPAVAYAAVQLHDQVSFRKSTDFGATWKDLGLFGIWTWGMDQDPVTGDLCLGSFHNGFDPSIVPLMGVYKSYDRGESWQRFGNVIQADPQDVMNVWMIKTADDSTVHILNHPTAFSNDGKLFSLKPAGLGRFTGTVTDSATGLPLTSARIVVPSTGDSVLIGNDSGRYAGALPPGNYSVVVKAAGTQKTFGNVTITADSSVERNFQLPVGVQTGSIGGHVRNESNEDIASFVMLHGSGSNGLPFVLTDTSDSSGDFGFDGLTSLESYDSLVVVPEVPYARASMSSPSLPSFNEIVVEPADLLLIVAGEDPAALDEYTGALSDLGVSWSLLNESPNQGSASVSVVGGTGRQLVFLFAKADSVPLTSEQHDSLLAIVDAGYNLVLMGQNLLEDNAALPLFQDRFGLAFTGDYPNANDRVIGFSGNPVGDGLNIRIRFSVQNSRDAMSVTNPGTEKAFHYGISDPDTVFVAGVTVDNTGSGGKGVLLGFDLDVASPGDIRDVLTNIMNYIDGITAIDESVVVLPRKQILMQNYPNPFNPFTTIRYAISQSARVELTVYNLLGQPVRKLVSSEKTAGWHDVLWDGKNEARMYVASGIYIYRLTAGNRTTQRKMLFLK